jgi:hypothetical protein
VSQASRQKKGFGEGRSPTRFSFTYEDVAQALGCSIQAARKHAQRGNYDPNNLMSILEFIQHKLSKQSGTELKDLVAEARSEAQADEK